MLDIRLTFFSPAAYSYGANAAGASLDDQRASLGNGALRYFFEDYAFDTDRRELRRGPAVVATTPQVFDLLDYLIRNRDRVVSKDDLVRAIWNGRIVSDAALTTRLNAVRSAIGDSGEEQRLIKTLPRKGFRFVGSVREAQGPASGSVTDNPVEPPKLALSLPDKPSIAILPFTNLSSNPEQDYFADGIVDDITTALSRFKSLFVIARNSSFVYKGKSVDIKQVGRDLGVRYVLEGSVRRTAGKIRIAGQLIDVTTGAHLWADRFESEMGDIFDLQDRVTQQVVGAVAREIDRAEMERASRRTSGNIDAVTETYRGLPHIYWPTTPEQNDAAFQHFKNAIAVDPTFAPAYGGATSCLLWRRANRWPVDVAADDSQLLSFAERIKELNTDDALALSTIGYALFHNHLDFDTGIELVDRAIRSNPNYASAYRRKGLLQVWDGGSDGAIANFEHGMRLSPRDPFSFISMAGMAFAHFNACRYGEAAGWADKSIRASPRYVGGLEVAIACYVGAGRLKDAQRVAADCLRMSPGWRRDPDRRHGIRSPEVRAKFREAFLRAGLPE
jgi:TolB-like protein